MFLLILALSGRLAFPQFTNPTPAVVPLGRVDAQGLVEVCNGAPVSPSHVVTLYSFADCATPFVITEGGRLLPDSTLFFRDLGLAMLVFDGEPFRRWNDPTLEATGTGQVILVAGYRSDGITLLQAHATDLRNDGSIVLSVAPAPGLMGAGAYNSSGSLIGIITGTITDASGNERLALLPTQLWSVWSSNIVNGVLPSGTPFGVSAIAYTLGEIDEETPSGVMIIDVCQGSRAQCCGLQKGDVVTSAGGVRVYHPESLRGMINAGDDVDLTVYRSGSTLSLTIAGE